MIRYRGAKYHLQMFVERDPVSLALYGTTRWVFSPEKTRENFGLTMPRAALDDLEAQVEDALERLQ